MMNNKLFFVSIIIPVYNNNEQLKTCLMALQNQTYSSNNYEIIIVDNGSTETVITELKTLVKEFNNVILTQEENPGSYGARNKGISLAKGEILAFTDSDCIPTETWLEKGVKMLIDHPESGLVAGKIEIFPQFVEFPTPVEIYENFTYLRQDLYLQNYHFGATANLFTFRKIFEQIGLFDGTLKSGGDVEWGNRVFEAGYLQLYCEDALICHPARRTFQDIKKKLIRTTQGDYILKKRKNDSNLKFWLELIRMLIPPLKFPFVVLMSKKKLNLWQRLMTIYVSFYAKYLVAYEKIRLKLGGELTAR
jgi:glycosyltransferase involved in cell wall biosynthesis